MRKKWQILRRGLKTVLIASILKKLKIFTLRNMQALTICVPNFSNSFKTQRFFKSTILNFLSCQIKVQHNLYFVFIYLQTVNYSSVFAFPTGSPRIFGVRYFSSQNCRKSLASVYDSGKIDLCCIFNISSGIFQSESGLSSSASHFESGLDFS